MVFRSRRPEDPWDRKPDRRPAAPEPQAPPMVCPWCGKDMAQGYLYPTRGGSIWWIWKKLSWVQKLTFGPDPKASLLVSDEGVLFQYKTAWHCPDCRKIALDAANLRAPYDTGGIPGQSGEESCPEEETP